MFKFIILVLFALIIIGSGEVFEFSSQEDIWIITLNHQELFSSLVNGFNISYDYMSNLSNNSDTDIKQ
jgi:hypothetical protein